MESKVRKRGPALQSVDVEDQSIDIGNNKKTPRTHKFHWDLWLLLAVENWLFDFGRPIFALFIPQSWFPMNYPSVGDYCHMAYNVITPFCLLKLFERSPNKTSSTFNMLCIVTFVMGASIHLVGDSINHRLVLLGYELHLSVRENPMMQTLEPRGLVDSFELLYLYDEVIGHLMWYIPFFISFFLYFVGCFTTNNLASSSKSSISWWLLMIFSSVYYWYLVTEGQIFVVYFITLICMTVVLLRKKNSRQSMDINGRFLFYSFSTTLVLVALWVIWLWNDAALRHKYPGLLYIPEPWSYYTLYIKPTL